MHLLLAIVYGIKKKVFSGDLVYLTFFHSYIPSHLLIGDFICSQNPLCCCLVLAVCKHLFLFNTNWLTSALS